MNFRLFLIQFKKKWIFFGYLAQNLNLMKKSLIILAVFALMTACKDKISDTKTGVSTTENAQNEEYVVDVSLNEIETEEGINTESNTSLQKNEDDTYSFRFNLKKGDTYPFRMKITTDESMTMSNQSASMSSTRTVDFDYFVENINNTNFILKATFLNFSESFKAPTGETISFNTAQGRPANEDVAKNWAIYKAISGQSFTMEVNNRGKVISVKGLDKVRSNAFEKIKSDFTAEEQTYVKDLLENSLSVNAIKVQFEESMNIFPERNLKIGEKWEDVQNINEGPVTGKNTVTRTFEGIKDGVARVKVDGVMNVGGSETQQDLTMTIKNNSTIDGTIDVDIETGWLNKVHFVKNESSLVTYQQGDMKETESVKQTVVTTVN